MHRLGVAHRVGRQIAVGIKRAVLREDELTVILLDDIGDCRVSDDAEAVFGEVFRVRNAVAQCRMPYGTWLVLTAPDKNAVVCVASENHRVAIGGDDASPAFGRGQRVAYLQRVGRFGRCCCQRDRAVGFGEGVCALSG